MVRTEFNPDDEIDVFLTSGLSFLLRREDIQKVFLPTIKPYAQIIVNRDSVFYQQTQMDSLKIKDRKRVSEFWFGYDLDKGDPELDAFEAKMLENVPNYDPEIFLDECPYQKPRDPSPSVR